MKLNFCFFVNFYSFCQFFKSSDNCAFIGYWGLLKCAFSKFSLDICKFRGLPNIGLHITTILGSEVAGYFGIRYESFWRQSLLVFSPISLIYFSVSLLCEFKSFLHFFGESHAALISEVYRSFLEGFINCLLSLIPATRSRLFFFSCQSIFSHRLLRITILFYIYHRNISHFFKKIK